MTYRSIKALKPKNMKNNIRFTPETKINASQVAKIKIVCPISGCEINNKIIGETFPAGTLTGAPKHMAMQLIEKYESSKRSFYGGAIGFIGFDYSYNHAIIIRSFLSKNKKLFFQAGAGIVSKSSKINELNEVNNKVRALKKSIEQAEKYEE